MEQKQTNNNQQQLINHKNKQRHAIISQIQNRFVTYGYEPIDIPTYESYDLYTAIQGTVQRQDMVKTIDSTGEVLVLRPDVTIPVMKKIAEQRFKKPMNMRYYYTLNVFRHSFGTGKNKERTQAGVELLGDQSIEADAELVALAVHSLRDLSLTDFKIELGHAEFLKHLLDELDLSAEQQEELKQLIHSKNMIELTPFLKEHTEDKRLIQAIQQIPLIYGQPENVFSQAKDIIFNETMANCLTYLKNLYQLLQDYGVSEHVVIDLGLVNHMDYYSGIIFQGFVDTVGKTVLMGGRYDDLAKQFNTELPAVGFALDIDTLLSGIKGKDSREKPYSIYISYARDQRQTAFSLANLLREGNYCVITAPLNRSRVANTDQINIMIDQQAIQLQKNNQSYTFKETKDIYHWLNQRRQNIGMDDTRFS